MSSNSEEKKLETNIQETQEKDNNKNNESEDPELIQFKEEALQKCIIEKALSRPETNCCTYNKGYITQECFCCLTCFNETKKRAVLCLGCSIKCHEDNHEIVPIGFKRHIRCDCGNNNFLIECKLKKKEEIEYDNPENIYNHNMENKYCYCDEEDDGNYTMAQCFFCEDWFHKQHLNIFGNYNENKNDDNNKDDEEELPNLDLCCKNCVKQLKDILIGYDLKKIIYGLIPKDNIKIIELSEDKSEECKNNFLGKKRKFSNEIEEIKEEDNNNNNSDNKNDDKDNDNNINLNNINKCKMNFINLKENEEFINKIINEEKNLFIDCEIFLKILCHCDKCKNNYEKIGMEFLIKENTFKEWTERKTFDDIINDEHFIEEAKNGNQITLDNLQKSVNEFLGSKDYKQLTLEQQILIKGYISELWNKLGEYLSTLNHSIITVEDIYHFINKYKDYFESLKEK